LSLPFKFSNQNNTLCIFISPMRATCPALVAVLHFITLITFGKAYKLWSSSLCSLLQPPATSSLLGPNNPSALFSDTLSLYSALNVRDQLSHPYKTTSKIIVIHRQLLQPVSSPFL
jgi:hypothetical protein